MAKKSNNKKTYYPEKSFDDDYDGLTNLFVKNKWSFSGTDTKQMVQDVKDQRQERHDHDELESDFDKLHTEFGENQEGRYKRYARALNAARGAFRDDKKVMAQLDEFKRTYAKVNGKKQTTT